MSQAKGTFHAEAAAAVAVTVAAAAVTVLVAAVATPCDASHSPKVRSRPPTAPSPASPPPVTSPASPFAPPPPPPACTDVGRPRGTPVCFLALLARPLLRRGPGVKGGVDGPGAEHAVGSGNDEDEGPPLLPSPVMPPPLPRLSPVSLVLPSPHFTLSLSTPSECRSESRATSTAAPPSGPVNLSMRTIANTTLPSRRTISQTWGKGEKGATDDPLTDC